MGKSPPDPMRTHAAACHPEPSMTVIGQRPDPRPTRQRRIPAHP